MPYQVMDDHCLQEKFLNLLLDVGDLGLELGSLVLRDAGGDDGPGDPAGAAQRLLGPHEHVRHVLVLAQQGNVQQDLPKLSHNLNVLRISFSQGSSDLLSSIMHSNSEASELRVSDIYDQSYLFKRCVLVKRMELSHTIIMEILSFHFSISIPFELLKLLGL